MYKARFVTGADFAHLLKGAMLPAGCGENQSRTVFAVLKGDMPEFQRGVHFGKRGPPRRLIRYQCRHANESEGWEIPKQGCARKPECQPWGQGKLQPRGSMVRVASLPMTR